MAVSRDKNLECAWLTKEMWITMEWLDRIDGPQNFPDA